MRRILIAIAGLVVIAGIVFFSYQHIKQQQAKDSSQMFDVVMNEKMSELYERLKIGLNLYNSIFMINGSQGTISKSQNFF
jgi:flagellar biosynthesis protein FliR